MPDARSTRCDEILDAALDLPPAERPAFLTRVCGSDTNLHAEITALLDAASPTDDFLEQPALASRRGPAIERPLFEPATVLAGRFQIVRFIGRGGMGEVYEANDLELGTSIALKTIRASIASDESVVARFRTEVLQARTVSHRNVCRVYDLFAHDTADRVVRFLTMELLPGTTLAERLRQDGPLALDEALSIADQVAGALDEAHALGIVHRDLKPGNIVLVPEGDTVRAVVSDFGLSLRLTEGVAPTVPLAERDAGTDDYIAPEQRASGIAGPAADLYAFGVLLHVMLTGHPPRQGVEDDGLPRACKQAIAACLQDDPAARPQSAAGVLRMAAPRRWRATRSRIAVIGLALLLACVSLIAFVFRFPAQGSRVTSQSVVLADFSNDTGETDLTGITEMLRQQLNQSAFLTVVEPAQVAETLARMVQPGADGLTLAQAREVAWRRGVDAIVSGRIGGRAPSYILTVRLERRGARPDAVGPTQVRSFDARDRADLQRAVQRANRWVRLTAGEAPDDIPRSDRSVDEVTSNSWQAVALFSRAQALSAQSRQEDALALFAEAVRLDPDFALAWMRMGDILMSRRQLDEAYQRWNVALEVFRRRKLAPREDYRIRGMFASDTHDYAEAERIYRLYLVAYPNDFAPYFYIARPLLMLGRTDDAIAMLETARAKAPGTFSVLAQLAMLELRAGRFDASAKTIAALRELGQTGWADCIQGQLDFVRGAYGDALARFESLEASPDALLRTRAPALRAAALADLGHTAAAIARLTRGLARDIAAGDQAARADKLIALASLHLRANAPIACRDACILVEQVDQSPVRTAQVAALLAQAGFPADAERLLARLPAASPSRRVQADRQRIIGEVLLARRKPQQAWSAFQRAAALEAPGVLVEYLARGAAAAGERGTALALYERIARDPAYYWRYPDNDLPGTWRAALETYLTLVDRWAPDTDTTALAKQRASLMQFALPRLRRRQTRRRVTLGDTKEKEPFHADT